MTTSSPRQLLTAKFYEVDPAIITCERKHLVDAFIKDYQHSDIPNNLVLTCKWIWQKRKVLFLCFFALLKTQIVHTSPECTCVQMPIIPSNTCAKGEGTPTIFWGVQHCIEKSFCHWVLQIKINPTNVVWWISVITVLNLIKTYNTFTPT